MTKEERGEGDEESEEEVAKPTLKARMATFFRVNKGFSADEEKATPEETKENGDITKENGDAKTDMNEDEKEAEKKDEEQTTNESTEDKVVIEKEKTRKSYRSYITKMFKHDSVSDKKGEESVKILIKENGDAKTDMNENEKEAEKEDDEQTTDETTEDKVIIEKDKTDKSYKSK